MFSSMRIYYTADAYYYDNMPALSRTYQYQI